MKKGKKISGGAASSTTYATSTTASSLPPASVAEHDPTMLDCKEIMTFDQPFLGYGTSTTMATMSADMYPSAAPAPQGFVRRKSVKADSSIELRGPMEIDGSVKSMGTITFNGDFAVRDRIEAYGNIVINGNLTCSSKIKAFGNVQVTGSALCAEKIKVLGKLKIVGTFEAQSAIEVWGALSINGCMKCKSLTAYASVTTVGDQSWYSVEEEAVIHGARLVQREDFVG